MGKIIQIIISLIFFILGLVYVLAPSPQNINDIPAIPNSVKSDEPGDTYQNPNIAAYHSDWWREDVTNFYKQSFEQLNNIFGIALPAIKLNHPPEESFQYIRDQQRSTFLEQYIFPLRGSLFVNGYEPISKAGKRFDSISVPVEFKGEYFNSKTTIRFYPVALHTRIIFYLGIWVAILSLLFLTKKIWRDLKA